MEQNKLYAALIGICIGSIMGYIISIQLLDRFDKCKILRQQNKMLKRMLDIKSNMQQDSLQMYYTLPPCNH